MLSSSLLRRWLVNPFAYLALACCDATPASLPAPANTRPALHMLFDLHSSVPVCFEPQIFEAVSTWASALEIVAERCSGCTGPNVVRFRFVVDEHGDSFPFHIGTAKLAHVVSSKSDRRTPEVHFNAYHFLECEQPSPDIYTTALHEIGHVLGLSHSFDQRSVMYPQYQKGGQILSEELRCQFLKDRLGISPSEDTSKAFIPPKFERR